MDSDWRMIDEVEFESMKKVLETFPNIRTMESRVCAFIGGGCDEVHLVDVPVLAGMTRIFTQEDLDVYLWLPNSPYVIQNVTCLERNRLFYDHDPGNGCEMVRYCCVFYDQETMAYLQPSNSVNQLVRTLMYNNAVSWRGEILIVKTLQSGRVLNLSREDFKHIPGLLKWLCANGRVWDDSI